MFLVFSKFLSRQEMKEINRQIGNNNFIYKKFILDPGTSPG